MRRKVLFILLLVISVFLSGCSFLTPSKDSEEKIKFLEDQINALEQEIANLEEEVSDLEQENSELKNEDNFETISQLRDDITNLNNQINQLEMVIDALNEGREENETLIGELQAQVNKLKSDKDELIKQIQDLSNEKEALSKTIRDLQASLEEATKAYDTLKDERDDYLTSLTETQEELKTLKENHALLTEELQKNKEVIEELNQTVTSLDEEVSKYKTQNQNLQANLEEREKEIESLETQIEDLKNNNGTSSDPELESQIEKLTNQLEKLQKEYDELEAQSKEDKEKIDELETQVADLKKENEELRKQLICEYQIGYELDGGINNSSNITLFSTDMEGFTLLPAIKEGYAFLGWFTESTFENKIETITNEITSDLTLYAKFVLDTYVSNAININNYNSQSATSNFEAYMGVVLYNIAPGSSLYWHKIVLVKQNNDYVVSEIIPSGSSYPTTYDYVLLSYNSPDNPSYEAFVNCGVSVGDVVSFSKDLSTLSNGEVDLQMHMYASGAQYSNLKLEANGGEVTYTNYYSDQQEVILPTPIKEGCAFMGWYDNEELMGETYTKIAKGSTGDKVFYAAWIEQDVDGIWANVSNPVTSTSKDVLPSEFEGYNVVWESSDINLYTIKEGYGYTNRKYQTHQRQEVTITATLNDGGEDVVFTKTIIINPVLYDEMEHPAAAYFSISNTSSYMNNSERYQTDGTLFSDNFRENMDMVYYSFAIPQANGTLTLDTQYLDLVKELKNDGIRVLMVIDGANKAPLQAMVQLCNDDTTRATFVNNILELVEKNNFDGVDVDWEFPGTSGLDGFTTAIDQVNLNKLLRDLRNGLDELQDVGGSNYILSAAIPATSWGAVRYDYAGNSTLGGVDDYCDYVNMMSYDLNNTEYTTHVASHAPSSANGDYKFGSIYGTEKFVELGLSKNKIILGTAAYGKVYSISATIDTSVTYPGLGLSASLTQLSGVTGSYASGTIYYTGITELMKDPNYVKYTEMNGDNVVASYLLNVNEKIFITYDSAEAVKAKCEYAKANEGMGVMVWAYGEDATDTVINTICDNLK